MIGRKLLRFSPIALVLVAAACGSGGGTKTVTVTVTVEKPRVSARIYLVRDGKVAPVSRKVPSVDDPADLLLALRAGPTATERSAGLTTAVPGVNRLALAQIIYTLSQPNPSKPVAFRGRAYIRSEFENETPLILVESPLPFAQVASPLRVTGTSDTFEATFEYDLVDAAGKVIAHDFVTATSGNGVRGTFDFTVPFAVSQAGPGKLVVYEVSAANGQRVHQTEIPLTLEP